MHGENDELRGFFSVTRDLTEQSEQRRRALHFALVRALADCTDVDAAAETILELTTLTLGATFGEMFVARQEQGRLDSTMRHAFPRATPRCARCRGGRRSRARRCPDRSSPHHRHTRDRRRPQRTRNAGAGRGRGRHSACAPRSRARSRLPAGIVGVLAYFFETLPSVETRTVESITEISEEAAHVGHPNSRSGRAARRSAPHGGARRAPTGSPG